MDKFRQAMSNQCGWGGFRCPCCNCYHGKTKKKLNRLARAKIKAEVFKEIKRGDFDG